MTNYILVLVIMVCAQSYAAGSDARYSKRLQRLYMSGKRAVCVLKSVNGGNIEGTVTFYQKTVFDDIEIGAEISGLNPNEQHGFHVHTYGDLRDKCESTGGHFNPTNAPHGAFEDEHRHYGDLPMLEADGDGVAQLFVTDHRLNLYGEEGILGRSVIVHSHADDIGEGEAHGSAIHGNAGPRVACCIIGLAPV